MNPHLLLRLFPVVLLSVIGLTPLRASSPAAKADSLGELCARRLAAALEGKGGIIAFRHKIDDPFSERIQESFLITIQRDYPGIEILLSDFHTGGTPETAFRIAQGVLARFPGANGIFTASGSATEGVIRALSARDMRPALAGIAESPSSADSLRKRVPHGQTVVLAIRTWHPASARELTDSFSDQRIHYAAVPPSPRRRADRVVPGLGIELMRIPPGRIGTRILTDTFFMGRYEITQQQWRTVMERNPSRYTDPLRPVECVSWLDAMEFCRRLTEREHRAGRLPADCRYTLPTEAQWDIAAQDLFLPEPAGTDSLGWHRGNSGAPAREEGIRDSLRRMATHRTGEKAPNRFGLYDLIGNVNEWCLDSFGPLPAQPSENFAGTGNSRHHVLKGGCWWADPISCLPAKRHKAPENRKHSALGFRIVLVRESETFTPKPHEQ